MKSGRATILDAKGLKIGYPAKRGSGVVVAEQLQFQLRRGELVALIGPNGSGKSTLIRTLARMQSPMAGVIRLEGEEISLLTVREVAKRVSTVLTDRITIGNLTVYGLIAFGRSPYTGMLGRLGEYDHQIVRWAVEAVGLERFEDRDISKLSDGERQKVMIARALAQDTPLILLDEPTAHLDLPNRVEIVRLLRKLAHETGKAILMSTHELDLALKASDQVWLMNMESGMQTGVPEDLVLNGTFGKVFHRDGFDFDRETGSFRIHRSGDKAITLSGEKVPKYWTGRALEREGFEVHESETEGMVHVMDRGERFIWRAGGTELGSVRELIDFLRAGHES